MCVRLPALKKATPEQVLAGVALFMAGAVLMNANWPWTLLVAPSRVVINAVGRVGDHQVRLDSAEHALDVRRDRAVAAEEAVPAEEPQIARLRHGMLGSRRRLVRVGETLGPVGHQVLPLGVAEPGQR